METRTGTVVGISKCQTCCRRTTVASNGEQEWLTDHLQPGTQVTCPAGMTAPQRHVER